MDIENQDLGFDSFDNAEKKEESENVTAEKGIEVIGKTVGELSGNMSRREFLKFAGILFAGGASASLLNACAKYIPDEEKLNNFTEPVVQNTQENKAIDNNVVKENEYAEAGLVLLEDSIKLDTSKFIMNNPYYPTALTEGTQLDGKNLKYGEGIFPEVTYLHYTGEIPPVAGEIIPLMYKVPKNIHRLNLVPYAISVNREFPVSIELNIESDYFVVPVITTGQDRSIVPSVFNGEIVSAPSRAFNVKPDPVSYNSDGYISWGLLTHDNGSIIFNGIVDNSNMYIDYENVPEEISKILETN